ncbi:hypothetical protein FACS189434_09550 [Bacteroidia bacterium]|nr:hypothetical protein FACS189434_09550 [Bacteroidia bacterium]
MEEKTITAKEYNKTELIANIQDSEFLFSISTLTPEKWIRNNDIENYVETILNFINTGKTVGRITLIDNQKEFEEKFFPQIKKGYIEYVRKYLNDTELKTRKQKLRLLPAFKKLNEELLLDTLMVFGVIHSNIEDNAFIVWKDKNQQKNRRKEIDNALEYIGESYDELLIYSNKFCGVTYLPNSTDVKLTYYNEIDAITDMQNKWNELKTHIENGTIKGINICAYLAKWDKNLSEINNRNLHFEKYRKPYNCQNIEEKQSVEVNTEEKSEQIENCSSESAKEQAIKKLRDFLKTKDGESNTINKMIVCLNRTDINLIECIELINSGTTYPVIKTCFSKNKLL